MLIDFSKIAIIPADESFREFSYQVKKTAEGEYIKEIWGWNEEVQIKFHSDTWRQNKPSIILYDGKNIGTISVIETAEYFKIGQFFILPEYQNRRIGSFLLKSILDKADSKSLPSKLSCLDNNPAISLYRRFGFEPIRNEAHFIYMERKPQQKYKAILFDLFGTLVDVYDVAGYASSLRETSSILKMRHEDFLKVWQDTADKRTTGGFSSLEENLEYICRELNFPIKKFDINLAKMVRYDFLNLALTPRLYAAETLSELKKEGYKLALVSNCSIDIPVVWQQIAIKSYFDVTIFSCNCGLKKPDSNIFLMAIEQLGVKPEECLFIDDDINNLTAAESLGIKAVLVTSTEENELQPVAKPADVEWNGLKIKELPEILDILEDQHEI